MSIPVMSAYHMPDAVLGFGEEKKGTILPLQKLKIQSS